jgi:hypothetical protein
MAKHPTHPRFNVIEWDGKTITKPGLYHGVSMAAYHSGTICDGPSVSGGGLRTIIRESPAHYFDKCPYNPNRAPDETTAAMTLGGAAHHLLLGEQWFSKHYCIRPTELPDGKTGEIKAWQGNRTDCKKWLAEHERKGLTVLTPDQVEAIKGMAASLGKHPLVRAWVQLRNLGLAQALVVQALPLPGRALSLRQQRCKAGCLTFARGAARGAVRTSTSGRNRRSASQLPPLCSPKLRASGCLVRGGRSLALRARGGALSSKAMRWLCMTCAAASLRL